MTSIQTLVDVIRDQKCIIKPQDDKQFTVHYGEGLEACMIPTNAADLAIAFTCVAADKDFRLQVEIGGRSGALS